MSGKGRGRGWLKLDRNLEKSPGIIPDNKTSGSIVDEAVYASVTPLAEKLVHSISQCMDSDNRKRKLHQFNYIKDLLTSECKSKEEIEEAFLYTYHKALHEDAFQQKFITFTSNPEFSKLEVCDLVLRRTMFTKMQGDFENAEALQKTDKVAFHNAIRLLGGFYNKAETKYSILTFGLIKYLEMLLDLRQPEDIELFISQLYLNGRELLEAETKIPTEIYVKIRNLLITDNSLNEISKVRLLLALDLRNNDFRMLPSDLLNFYQSKLGEKDVHNLQKNITIQIFPPSKVFTEYPVSEVSVLQLDTSSTNKEINQQLHINQETNRQEQQYHLKKSPNYNSHKNMAEEVRSNNDLINHRNSAPKTGRPILGAGARNNVRTEFGPGDRNNDGAPPTRHKNFKGWEHDDRFENDYN